MRRCFLAFVALIMFAPAASAEAQDRKAFCQSVVASCQAGCARTPAPGPNGVEDCKQKICAGSSLAYCNKTGCFPFKIGAAKCMEGVTPVTLGPVRAEEISLKNNESAELSSVYWIGQGCKSLLKSFAGVDILEGPPGVTLAIKEEMVYARRQNCPNKVPGGKVIATAKGVQTAASGNLKYRVRYKTADGERQSSHSVAVSLYP
jgi:hypothetical protein